MGDHLAVQQYGGSLAGRILELIYLLCDDAIDYLWSIVTKKSKLERMLDRESLPPSRMLEIEHFLIRKLHLHTNLIFRSSDDCDNILAEGSVTASGRKREELKERLETVVAAIDSYEELKSQIESIRSEKYDSNNPSHEDKLRDLWCLIVPHEALDDRIGKQWRYIGFQGDDPATDFRGMGILSLDQLIYLAKNYPKEVQHMLVVSHHPKIGFPLAVAGITFTAVTRHLLACGKLKKLFYQSKENMDLGLFHETYCKIFIAFVNFWKSANPTSIMDFNLIRAQFERKVIEELARDRCNLTTITA